MTPTVEFNLPREKRLHRGYGVIAVVLLLAALVLMTFNVTGWVVVPILILTTWAFGARQRASGRIAVLDQIDRAR